MADLLFWLIIGFIAADFIAERILTMLNTRNMSPEIPEEMRDYMDKEKYARSQEYEKTGARFSLISSTFSLVLILAMLFFGGFAILDEWVRGITTNPIWMALLFFGVIFIAQDLLTLPFSLYRTFVIEERFGFNKTTPATFIVDKLKGYVLLAIIGGGLLALIVFIYGLAGPWFWIIAWGVVTVFTLLFTMFYTSILVPLFNKLKPLEEGELLQAIRQYADKVSFPLQKIMVMDGSKRSTKANAYFSGLGGRKTIVLFDTLIDKHSREELVSVLAHEVGHYKKKHVMKNFFLGMLQTGMLLFLLNLLLGSPVLAEVLGAKEGSFHLSLIGFSLLYAPVSFVLGILMNMYSRKNEFEADAYAKATYGSEPLKTALKKLSVENLSNLTPHPAYVFVHYSHPPVLQRLRALDKG